MRYYVIIDKSDVTQEMINRSTSRRLEELRTSNGTPIIDPVKCIIEIEKPIQSCFINKVIYTESEIKKLMQDNPEKWGISEAE